MIAVEVVVVEKRMFCSMDDLITALEALKYITKNHDESEGVHKTIEVVEQVKMSFVLTSAVNFQ